MVSWLFLAVSVWGAAFTLNALRPSYRWQFVGPSFFAEWLTAELAWWHLAWQAVATGVFAVLGAFGAWPGWVGLGITVASWVGLVAISREARGSADSMKSALAEVVGPDDLIRTLSPDAAAALRERRRERRPRLPFKLTDRRVERIGNLRYAPGAGRRHLLDVYRPRGGARNAPVLLQIHGGGWVIGTKRQQALPLMMHMAASGWVCVAANYRLSPKATWPEHLVDVKAALAWIRENIAGYGGDPDFVVVTGGSAGGHLAALVGLTANRPEYQPGFEDADTSVAAAVPIYGVYDLLALFEHHGPAGRGHAWLAKMIMKATVDEEPERYRSASPVDLVHPDVPPFLVIHGSADNLVPVDQARRFVAAMRAASPAPVAYAEIQGASHAFEVFHGVRTGNVVAGIDEFLTWLHGRHLSGALTPVAGAESPTGGAAAAGGPPGQR